LTEPPQTLPTDMKNDLKNPLSDENVCRTLVQNKLISQAQAKNILSKREPLKRKLKQRTAGKKHSAKATDREADKITIIDVIGSLKIKRIDNPSLTLDEEHIYQVLAGAWQVPYKKIDPLKLDLNVVTSIIPHSFARRHLVLPLSINDGRLTVATPNPFNSELLEDIARASNLEVQAVVSSKGEIVKLINEFFGFKRSITAAEDQFSSPLVDLGNLEQYVRIASDDELPSNDQHIVKAVNHLFIYALDQKSSDIHLEPKREAGLVRMRIDGILHTVYKIPKNVHTAIVSRIKSLSRMDIAEKRRPQDGRIKTGKDGAEVEVRVSMIPTAFGEKVVMRIMDPDILFQDLEKLGFTATDLIRYNALINVSNGIVLVCGPTGSGKSTTLYSTLRYLHSPEINITTVEDPIEMIHQDFNQISVNPVVGINFGNILRNILRQDPDVIMIGEMRDLETAENAVQAALTGHLVLSTLHTNDAPTSVTRLIDLGIPPFLIQATLRGVLAQRLVRKICPHCKEKFVIDAEELDDMGLHVGRSGKLDGFRGRGCQRCRGTGYKGRTGIHEVLPYSETIKKITVKNTDLELLRAQAIKEGMVNLRENAIRKFLDGATTYQEVLRVTWEQF